MALAVVHSRPTYFPESYLDIAASTSPWLVKGVLPTHGVAFLVGATKAGKSFLGIDTALRIAAGAKVLGRTTRQCGVVYLAAEDAPGLSRSRAGMAAQVPQRERLAIRPLRHAINLLDTSQVDLWMDAVEESCARFDALGLPLGVIIIDTLSRCLPGVDENASPDMSRAFVQLQRIGLRFGCLVMVLAHFGKAGGGTWHPRMVRHGFQQ